MQQTLFGWLRETLAWPALWLLLCGHLLGDFYWQNDASSDRKREHWAHIALHATLYTLALLLMMAGLLNQFWLAGCVIIGLLHFVIDMGKIAWIRQRTARRLAAGQPWQRRYPEDLWIFFFDQAVHVVLLIALAVIGRQSRVGMGTNAVGDQLLSWHIQALAWLPAAYLPAVLCTLLALGKPLLMLLHRTGLLKKKAEDEQAADLADRTEEESQSDA